MKRTFCVVLALAACVGLGTVSESKSVAARLYALLLGLIYYRSIRFRDLPAIFWETPPHTVGIMFIITTAGFFGWLLILHRIPVEVITGI